jgi:hypothetical protein
MPITRSWATGLFTAALLVAAVPVSSPAFAHRRAAVRLGPDDDGRSLHVLRGTRITLTLHRDEVGGYQRPTSDRPDVLRPDRVANDAGSARADFTAVDVGYATIISHRDQPCGLFDCRDDASPYRVQVEVDHTPED